MYKLSKKLKTAIEVNGWTIDEESGGYRISKYSQLGEDFSFSVQGGSQQKILAEINEYVHIFDPEDHAEFNIENRGKYGIPTNIRALLEDAEQIRDDLEDLNKHLNEVFKHV